MHLCLLKSHLCCLATYIYFVLNPAQSSGKKIIGNVTKKNYLKESLLSILCFIIQGKDSLEKGLILNCENLLNCLWFLTRIVFLVCKPAVEIGRAFCL